MLTKSKLIVLILVMGICHCLTAQNLKIADVISASLEQSGTIKNKDKVEGHYVLYSTGKVKKGEKNFTLNILDTELNSVIKKSIKLPKDASLLNGASNGTSLAFRFFLPKEKEILTKGYDYTGKQLFSKTIELQKAMEVAMITTNDAFFKDLALSSVPGYGYVQINPFKGKKMGYSMNFISDQEGMKNFSKKSDDSKFEIATNLCTVGSTVVNLVMSRDKALTTKDMDMKLQGIDFKTGKQTFKTSLKSKRINSMIIGGEPSPDGENIILYGLNFAREDKITKKPKGMIKIVMSKSGEIIDKFTFDWKGKSIKLDDGEEAGNLFVHDFIQSHNNGNTIVIAEQLNYDVGATVVGSVIGLATGGGNSFTFKVDDIVLIELDKEFKVVGIEVVEKSKNSYTLPGTPLGGLHIIGLVANSKGYMDYGYNQKKDDGFVIGYVNYEKAKGKKDGLVFGGVTCTDGEYSYDKIDISNKGILTQVIQGKTGHVVILDYFKKEKSLDIRLEKINF